jgi:hypothetical protein
MTRSEYLELEGLNFSAGQYLLRSPAHFLARLDEQPEDDKLLVQRLTHDVILQGTPLEEMVSFKPSGMNLATKEGKTWKGSQTLPIISEADHNDIAGMAQAVARHPQATDLLLACPERELVCQGEYHGVKTKGIIDGKGHEKIFDLKTTIDARGDAFQRQVDKYNWDLQAVWYQTFFPEHLFYWLAVENTPPYAVKVWDLEPEMQASGLHKFREVMSIYRKCLKANDWSAGMSVHYADDTQGLVPVPWRLKLLQGIGLV